jgi:hypothetical protein
MTRSSDSDFSSARPPETEISAAGSVEAAMTAMTTLGSGRGLQGTRISPDVR